MRKRRTIGADDASSTSGERSKPRKERTTKRAKRQPPAPTALKRQRTRASKLAKPPRDALAIARAADDGAPRARARRHVTRPEHATPPLADHAARVDALSLVLAEIDAERTRVGAARAFGLRGLVEAEQQLADLRFSFAGVDTAEARRLLDKLRAKLAEKAAELADARKRAADVLGKEHGAGELRAATARLEEATRMDARATVASLTDAEVAGADPLRAAYLGGACMQSCKVAREPATGALMSTGECTCERVTGIREGIGEPKAVIEACAPDMRADADELIDIIVAARIERDEAAASAHARTLASAVAPERGDPMLDEVVAARVAIVGRGS